ncbi:MAG: acetyl/propionyl/methylcrotonyl-CoA carboxylase subunit alpha [Gammaproteobacteria bacterium]|nr:acetyl/propionyl/methylcrotonyl-CoA carboxylase subunit alpha [Gammaproteobacteria bacterium]NNL00096.1 acetyl/propionyl/methylcrotonyl-CoA carboxylase subunit alpha [Xanthomonadales bacterium]
MFDKILIANRGEIACRVIQSAQKMGIRTVAVYSDADSSALHVQLADEAVNIGPPPSAQSYLLKDKIVQACLDTGAQAVHPGYGFLSENSEFCETLAAVGIKFIGPETHAIEAMGDKITSKQIAADAGVNTIPGFSDVLKDADHAVEIANRLGYPVMLKATAGGGGKGMRVAHNDAECREGFERASNEARSGFGDDRMFAEKFIEEPRHIEIQIIADSQGNVVYLNERECSLQRRHQKVIEEAPSPFLDEATRKKMGEQAVALAKAVDYQSAGTVEFIVDAKRNFYFLEMNTRLQVEHPVTELITGFDLVELMIRVANGEKLPITQADVGINGWAIESRVYAEDPFRNFLPSIGRLVYYRPPENDDHVRVDTGVYEGGEVSMYYDPMIAKLITYGADREEAIAHMRSALDRFIIRGVTSNLSFLSSLIFHPRFVSGNISTNTIGEEYPDGFHPADVPHEDPSIFISVVASMIRGYRDRAARIDGQLTGHERRVPSDWAVVMNDELHHVTVVAAQGGHDVIYNGKTYAVRSRWEFGQHLFSGTINGNEIFVQVEREDQTYRLFHSGSQVDVKVITPKTAEFLQYMPVKAPPDMSRYLISPMPGLLVSLAVEEGQKVNAGEELAVLEAMKMENTLLAERDCVVSKIHFEPGASLAVDDKIMEFE